MTAWCVGEKMRLRKGDTKVSVFGARMERLNKSFILFVWGRAFGDQKLCFIYIKFELLLRYPGGGVGKAARSQDVKSGGPWREEPSPRMVSEGMAL